jgi:hypothetical protein
MIAITVTCLLRLGPLRGGGRLSASDEDGATARLLIFARHASMRRRGLRS